MENQASSTPTQLTPQSAFNNIVIVVDSYNCNKQARISLDQSLEIVRDLMQRGLHSEIAQAVEKKIQAVPAVQE